MVPLEFDGANSEAFVGDRVDNLVVFLQVREDAPQEGREVGDYFAFF